MSNRRIRAVMFIPVARKRNVRAMLALSPRIAVQLWIFFVELMKVPRRLKLLQGLADYLGTLQWGPCREQLGC